MSVRNLDALFQPRAVAVVEASREPGHPGAVALHNLLRAGFDGPVLPVHPEAPALGGVRAWRRVEDLPVAPDLGVICAPPERVPALAEALAVAGARAAVVLVGGLDAARVRGGGRARDALARVVRRRGLRVLGPDSMGLLVPGAGLDASCAPVEALPGRIALLAQSSALCTAALDWARARGIGFSTVVSLGESLDVDVGDCLDYLAVDPDTRGILLYLEAANDARELLSAGRAASRNKPVVVVKAGRTRAGADPPAVDPDAVFDAAFRRAGMLRVDHMEELFDAVETLARSRPLVGDRVAVVGNAGGPGLLAADALVRGGGRLAAPGPELRARLDRVRQPGVGAGGANPVDLEGDASGARYRQALEALLDAPEVDALVVLHAPTAAAAGTEAAHATADAVAAGRRRLPVLTSWMGGTHAEPARRVLREAGLPCYEMPERAAQAFLHLAAWRRSQGALTEVPASRPGLPADADRAREVLEAALARGASWLSQAEGRALLAAYGIPHVACEEVPDADEAARAARKIQGPVALKIRAPGLEHKSDLGGVVLGLDSPEAVRAEARAMGARLREALPGAPPAGFTVQPMVDRRRGVELRVGAATDPLFGPVVLFGRGGSAADLIDDTAVELPPLNAALARATLERTRVWRRLRGAGDPPAADLDALCDLLVAVGRLVAEQPEVRALDMNPVVADAHGALALDVRVAVAPAERAAADRLAILPYPSDLEEEAELADGTRVRLRPIRPEDEPAHLEFFRRLDPEDVRLRFFGVVREMPHSQLARYTQIDYDREMAFVAEAPGPEGRPETLGVVRTIEDPDRDQAEFAVVVRSDCKGRGLGRALMEKMIRYCRARGVGEVTGQVLPDNRAMLGLASRLGFRVGGLGGDVVDVRLPLARGRRR